MALNNAYSTYKTANVSTTDQGKLILICYDVAIRSCGQAKIAISDRNIAMAVEIETELTSPRMKKSVIAELETLKIILIAMSLYRLLLSPGTAHKF